MVILICSDNDFQSFGCVAEEALSSALSGCTLEVDSFIISVEHSCQERLQSQREIL